MATITQGPTSANNSASPSSLGVAFGSNVTAGNMIAVAVVQWNVVGGTAAGRTVTVTDSLSNTYALSVASASVPGSNDIRIFYAKNIGGGANTVTAAFSGTGTTGRCEVVVWEVNGLDATAPEEDTNLANGSSATPSAGDVTMAGGGFALAGFVTENGRTGGAGSGWTGTRGAVIWGEAYYETRLPSTAGTYTGDFTLNSSDTWAAVVVAFKDSSGGSAAGAAAHYYRQMA